MDQSAKLRMLQNLDSETDWEALMMNPTETKSCGSQAAQQHKPQRKLTKGEKKRLKQSMQSKQVEETMKRKNVSTVVYRNPDAAVNKSRSKAKSQHDDVAMDNNDGIEIDMKQTRYEIMKFGMSSLTSTALADAESALAISLGARPAGKPAVNYRELQVQRKKEREEAAELALSNVKPKLKNAIVKKKPQSGKAADPRRKSGRAGRQSTRNTKLSRRRNKT